MNDDLHETIRSAVAESVATAMKSAMGEFAEALNGLATHMDERFDRLEGRVDQVEARTGNLELNHARLENSIQEVSTQQDQVMIKVDRSLDILDGIASRISDDDAERVALSAQVTRHEDWIVKAAPSTGVKYVPARK